MSISSGFVLIGYFVDTDDKLRNFGHDHCGSKFLFLMKSDILPRIRLVVNYSDIMKNFVYDSFNNPTRWFVGVNFGLKLYVEC